MGEKSGLKSIQLGCASQNQWCGKLIFATSFTSKHVVYYEPHQLQKRKVWVVLKIDSILAVYSEDVQIHLELVKKISWVY